MCHAKPNCDTAPLTFETMLTDPMIRLMMDSDGVTIAEMARLLSQAQAAVNARPAFTSSR